MKANLSYWEIEELAAAMLGKTEEYENESLENLDELFYDAFDIDTSQLHKLVEHLLPMIDAGQSITGCMHKGFCTGWLFYCEGGCMILQIIGMIALFILACYLGVGAFILFFGTALLGGSQNKGEMIAGVLLGSASVGIFYFVLSHFSVSLS